MKSLKKIASASIAVVLCMGMGISAFAFDDMPDGEMGKALQNAVNVGLMNGKTESTIAPYDNITRAEMAAIVTRAFSAEAKSDSKFNDVADSAWYADIVSKAVAMGAFQGDDDNNFKPENNITFQETYIVLSRIFGFEPYKITYKSKPEIMLSDCDESVLDRFSDKDEASDWAYNYEKYIVGNGGWNGIDGKLKPLEYIKRGEFAMLMDAVVGTYIDKPGTYKNLEDKLIMVRCGGVTIEGLKSTHNLIFTYGVDTTGVNVIDSTVNGVTLVLGGSDATPIEVSKGKLLPDESYITITGNYYDVRNMGSYVYLDAAGAKVSYYKGDPTCLVSLSAN